MKSKDKATQPTAEDFSKRKIKNKVLSDAIQHPATLFSAAAAMLSGLYMGLVSFDETSFAIALGSGLFSLASFIYQYFIKGEKAAEEHVKELLEKRRSFKEQQGEDIEKRCRQANFREGEKAARELKEAYTRLESYLKEKLEKKQTLTARRFLILAEESYYQGIQFLNKALSLFQAVGHMDERKLKKELLDWEKELEIVEKDTQKGEEYRALLIKALTEKIRSHRKRLELFGGRKETLDQVLAQCEILEATLDSTYLEVVDLVEDESYMERKNVARNLERAVAAARKVEDRLRGMATEKPDDLYDTHEKT